ncbi:AraC family transcriptional regulator [Sodalis sp. RH20]|uniref:AraC family transcriptional regulator n=1 Tax=unclassified Sodalis (in: enterobacteria) TaxID=2636512 RepID=UPI0039B593CD
MYNIAINDVDHVARPVVAIGTDYPRGFFLPAHRHRRAQLLYGASGVMHVRTRTGSWIVPPQHAVWVPPEMEHSVRFEGVSTRSLYIEPESVRPLFAIDRCRIVTVSPLLRQLLIEAVAVTPLYDPAGRDGQLINLLLHELALMPGVPFDIPLPEDARLLALCRQFLEHPTIHQPPEEWAARFFMSISTFRRFFRQQTGMACAQWRRRACVVLALARLADGEPVTAIAFDLGYESSAAFATMFRRELGHAPSIYFPQRMGLAQS